MEDDRGNGEQDSEFDRFCLLKKTGGAYAFAIPLLVFQRPANDQFCKHDRCIVITEEDILMFPQEDKNKLKGMLHRCYMEREVPYWRFDLEILLESGVKFEFEALSANSLSLLTESYLPSKSEWEQTSKLLALLLILSPTTRLNEKSCVLKVNVHCQACKMKMLEVLGSICGVYDVTIDSQEGLVKVYGVVNPNMLVRALTRTGYHAELKWVSLRHTELNRRSYTHNYYDHGYYGNGYPFGVLDDPYRYRRYLTDNSYPCSSRLRFDHTYYHGSTLPPARYVPSYPPREYDPYEDEHISFCSII